MLKIILPLLFASAAVVCKSQIPRQPIKVPVKIIPGTVMKKQPPTLSRVETTSPRINFVQVPYKIYIQKNLSRSDVKGILLLSSYDASLDNFLLIRIAEGLASEKCVVAIVKYRTALSNNFSMQADSLGKDYENVWTEIKTKYGGTISNTVVGGISFSGFALSYIINQPGHAWLRGMKGVALIAAGTSPFITVPVVNKVCTNDPDVNVYGNNGGTELQNAMQANNATIAALSSCETDNICSGHTTSDTWADFFILKIKNWFL